MNLDDVVIPAKTLRDVVVARMNDRPDLYAYWMTLSDDYKVIVSFAPDVIVELADIRPALAQWRLTRNKA